ncbi:hypothetical protein SLEP1_g9618 [Rubroshorea leprosula]|uniref:Reverse transcriptase domain-containing protein n=1 Tax=Rubroshorea leprosula TaxID=152421 RepID=A0AAV5IDY0_9ROSI|nr:hypothetical protein SLEP1_g9618 [Rubroshorea leprosula]
MRGRASVRERGPERAIVSRERGQWTTQRYERFQGESRNQPREYYGGFEKKIYNQATPFFFTNFPDEWSFEQMWRTFNRLGKGRVIEIECPKKRDRIRKRFGFVKFLEVKDAGELERKLNQIPIGGFNLQANKPRFEKSGYQNHQQRNMGNRMPNVATPNAGAKRNLTYAKIVKGNNVDYQSMGLIEGQYHGANIKEQSKRLRASDQTRWRWKLKQQPQAWSGMEFNISNINTDDRIHLKVSNHKDKWGPVQESEQTQGDEEDDMAIELRVPETELEDEAKGIDTRAHLLVDSSAKRSVNHQNKQKGLAERIEDEASVTGGPDECFQKANKITTGGLEGSTRKHLMIAGLEEERSGRGAEMDVSEEKIGNKEFFKKGAEEEASQVNRSKYATDKTTAAVEDMQRKEGEEIEMIGPTKKKNAENGRNGPKDDGPNNEELNSISLGNFTGPSIEEPNPTSLRASRGLIIIWNSDIIKKMDVFEGEGFIGIHGLWGPNEYPCFLCNVYSPCDLIKKKILWEDLEQLIRNYMGCWCLEGDFNAMKSSQERKGGKSVRRDIKGFEEFIVKNGLLDLPLLGRKYTWYQPNGRCMSRLDRFLFNDEWLLNWPDLKQWGLQRSLSDHCLILVKNEVRNWGPKPFKFFNALLHTPGFTDMVIAKWKELEIQGWGGFILKEKLKMTKDFLQVWSKSNIQEVDKKIEQSREEINRVDGKGETSNLSNEDIIFRSSHYTRGRWHRNKINVISLEGKELRQVEDIKQGVMKYFANVFIDEGWQRPTLEGLSFKSISEEDRGMLIEPFIKEEIKVAVWNCDSTKAPGPDGFTFGFIKNEWEVIKADIMNYVRDFHTNGRMVRGFNASFLVLILKRENPQGIKEYRPISLIGYMYKILAKVLANRLSRVLNTIIGENQSTFIKGRQLVDSVVVANEAIDEVRKRKSQCFVFKIDFKKAYDKVSWSFLDNMMEKMDFDKVWREWIAECLRSNTVSVLVNGSATKEFSMSRGLQQGDPLSPFLFLMVAKALNGLTSATVVKGYLCGVKIGDEELEISHLQFTDDTIFMRETTEDNIWMIKCIMRAFELVSGLKPASVPDVVIPSP